MAKRSIITIDEKKCTGCGLCIPNCPEGALRIIDDKARLVSDLFCDGLGACIGHCPEGAIRIEEREAAPYDERKVMETIVKQGANVIRAHLEHLKDHGEHGYMEQALEILAEKKIPVPSLGGHAHAHAAGGCPGSKVMDLRRKEMPKDAGPRPKGASRLNQWPVQIMLVPTSVPYFNNAEVLVAADCVPFAYADFHEDLLKGKILLVGCPKLDDAAYYKEKLTEIIKNNTIRSVTCAHMEVPCCFGLVHLIKEAIAASGKAVPFKEITIGIKGERK